MNTMRPWFLALQLSFMFVSGIAAAQVDKSSQGSQTPNVPPDSVTVVGKAPHDTTPLPSLPPDEFTDCMKQRGASDLRDPSAIAAMAICEAKLDWEKRIVVDTCINLEGKTTLPKVIQGCTESLDRKIFQGSDRFYLFANRADAYFAQGDQQRALDDYNEAVKLAPRNAKVYYNRGVLYAAQANGAAALRDFDTALSINPKLVPALQQRAKVDLTQNNLNGALADYSEAIRLQPTTAVLWSDRGYICLRLHNYESAVKDEAEAIRLDPKLARAYFLRGAAFGDLGDSHNALSDLVTAVNLDPSLDRYISSKGKTASISLPPI
jgi:tetratricopeptide (TPR) repeat protein